MKILLSLRTSKYRFFLFFLYTISTIALLYLSYKGLNYYLSPLSERPRHSDYQTLKPGGFYGHGFGILGSIMMMVMMLYSLRKRLSLFARTGPITKWLDLHIYLGIFGPLFIILHTTFKVNGLVAISFYSMLAVALSGILGRYLYLQIPRNIQGVELSLKEINDLDQKLSTQLKVKFAFTDAMLNQLDHLTANSNFNQQNTLLFLFNLLKDDLKRKNVIKKFDRDNLSGHKIPQEQVKTILSISRQKLLLHRRIQGLNRIQQLFHYWHVIHKPFAIIMLIIMIIHILIVVRFGYTWIL